MPDVKVNVTGTGSGHLDYPVPGGVEFILKQAYASFDGTSAAAAWYPAVRLIGPDGNVAGEYITASTVAAGGSADVTFAPFLKGKASTAAAIGLVYGIAYRNNFNVPTVASGGTANFDPWDFLDASGADLTLDGSGRVVINTAGLYQVNIGLQVLDATWLGTDTADLNFQLLTGGLSNHASTTWPGKTILVAPNNPSGTSREWELSALVWVNIITPPETIRALVFNITAAGPHIATTTFAVMSVLRVGDASSGGVN